MNDEFWPDWDDNALPSEEDELEFEREGFTPAPIVYPMQSKEVGDHFRNPGDDMNVVRVFNPDPDGCVRVAKNLAVAGVSFRPGEVTAFVFGNEQSLTLVAEPTNKYDPNAIMVMGSHQDNDGQWHEEHIGYVPKKLAATAKADELIVKLKTMFVPYQGKSPGVRMDLWKVDDLFQGDLLSKDEYAEAKEGILRIVKNEQLEQFPPAPLNSGPIRPIVTDSKHEPSWHKHVDYRDEPF